jgi:hypothetical protein
MDALAATVTAVEAVPPAGAVMLPLAGDVVSPDAPVSCHVIVAGLDPSVLSFSTSMLVDDPGASRTCAGLRAREARVLAGKCTLPAG